MIAMRRGEPYIWVTWLTKLLAGENQCEWAAWFRAHHKDYDRLPADLDVAAWTLEHAELVQKRRECLLRDGYQVFVEDENAFKRVGKTGIVVSGKPDLFAVLDRNGVIEDCKTGRPRASDAIQVLVYLLLFPIGNPRCAGVEMSGRVVYRTGALDVTVNDLDEGFRARFTSLVQRIGGDKPLPKNPVWTECRYCDIGPADCLYRVDQPPESAQAETDLF
ncbi:MAG: PD-(D/E)XK nuclease family protein [Candidatus Bipolaricaulota bacterium]